MLEDKYLIVGLEASIVALHPDTGLEMWRNNMQLGGHSFVALAVNDHSVFASANAKRIFCIDKQRGNTKWSQPTSGMGRATLIVSESAIFVSKGGFIDCFSLEGVLLWSKSLKKMGKKPASLAYGLQVSQADG